MGFRVVSVLSSKGGSGKSLVAANLAYELKAAGLKVGILDADIDSPYLVEIAGVKGKIGLDDQRRMVPVRHDGMPIMSFALWVPNRFAGASMVGSMHDRWITDALEHTDWGDIDILVVDLPAGTADELLTVSRVPATRNLGFIAVAMPNVLSGLMRVYDVASYHHQRILGVIENMSGPVFGGGHIQAYCREKGLKFFGTIPLDSRVRQAHSRGDPRLPEDLRGPVAAAAQVVVERMVKA